MDDSSFGGYSSNFWASKVIQLGIGLVSAWAVLRLIDAEKDDASFWMYPVAFAIAGLAMWMLGRFILDWKQDQPFATKKAVETPNLKRKKVKEAKIVREDDEVEKEEVKEATKEATASSAKKKFAPREASNDDLTKIEGVGPKIRSLLKAAGYDSFESVADADADDLKSVLTDAGDRFRLHDTTSWPEQAALAAAGDWDELQELQDRLDGGR